MATLTGIQAVDSPVWCMPSPPRIAVPAQSMRSFYYESLPKPPNSVPRYISSIDLTKFWGPVDPSEWRYTCRRQAQRILPFLYLGPLAASKDTDFLKQERITMSLALRHPRTMGTGIGSGAFRIAEELGIVVESMDVSDNQDLIAKFPLVIRTINSHLAAYASTDSDCTTTFARVLIYCDSGNERSAAVVVAYIMEVLNIELVDAIKLVQGIRFCVNIDDNLKFTLRAYEDLLKAKRDVNQDAVRYIPTATDSSVPCIALAGNPPKRSLKRGFEDEDGVMDFTDLGDAQRRTWAPFIDEGLSR